MQDLLGPEGNRKHTRQDGGGKEKKEGEFANKSREWRWGHA